MSQLQGTIQPETGDKEKTTMSLLKDTKENKENVADGVKPRPPERKLKIRNVVQPPGTIRYAVTGSDTLHSIAAKFDTTPSEVKKLNKLFSTTVFAGQTMYVPDPDYVIPSPSPVEAIPTVTSPEKGGPVFNFTAKPEAKSPTSPASVSPKPGHVERVFEYEPAFIEQWVNVDSQPPPPPPPPPPMAAAGGETDEPMSPTKRLHHISEEEAERLDKECLEKFLKINVKYITDGQGVVNGVLLVTPNAVMFDPNTSDILVIENSTETYSVMAPMETIISAAIFHDMSTAGGGTVGGATPEIYHTPGCPLHIIAQMKDEDASTRPAQMSRMSTITSEVSDHSDETQPNDSDAELAADAEEMPELTKWVLGATTMATMMSIGSEDGGTPTPKALCSCGAEEQRANYFFEGSQCSRSSAAVANPALAQSEYYNAFNQSETTMPGVEPQRPTLPRIQSAYEATTLEDMAAVSEGTTTTLPKLAKVTVPEGATEQDSVAREPVTPKIKLHSFHIGSSDLEQDSSSPDTPLPPSTPQLGTPQPTPSPDSQESPQPPGSPPPPEGSSPLHDSPPPQGSPLPATVTASADENIADGECEGDAVFTDGKDEEEAEPAAADAGKEKKRDNSKILQRRATFPYFSIMSDEPVEGAPDPLPSPEPRKMSLKMRKSNPVDGKPKTKQRSRSFRRPRLSSLSDYAARSRSIVGYTAGLLRGKDGDAKTRGERAPMSKADIVCQLEQQLWYTEEARRAFKESGRKSSIGMKCVLTRTDRPDLFASIDECTGCDLNEKQQLLTQQSDQPLYLCLKVGKSSHCPGLLKGAQPKRHGPEYWFAIPKRRVDHLYAFFIQWTPNIYGNQPSDRLAIQEGFVVIDDDTGVLTEISMDEEHFAAPRIAKDWEIITVEEARRRMSALEVELNLPIPELIGPTEILNESSIRKLMQNLPARAEGYSWSLIYSTSRDGFSLKSLYRSMQGMDTPVLLIVKDTYENVCGAITSCALKMSDHFYGTGESMLFTFYPEFKTFHWTGDNGFFIKGNKDSLSIGAGDGQFGLWFDSDLYHGTTHSCKTYDNDTLTSNEDFVIKALECWGFY
ncbi:PREDICTED: oxidation resistance protein 1-like isoform X2 [Priapulus caudatus]|uniref:Oxidation resistance protein 1 n=1 Tax=Priapulus caudatus TaxID=37621 RepID=A0ABM1E8G1_PRICU|nr:PREDICTED: oxidation resistance protein 1-like isoform X2 [Priapulus caudatus]